MDKGGGTRHAIAWLWAGASVVALQEATLLEATLHGSIAIALVIDQLGTFRALAFAITLAVGLSFMGEHHEHDPHVHVHKIVWVHERKARA